MSRKPRNNGIGRLVCVRGVGSGYSYGCFGGVDGTSGGGEGAMIVAKEMAVGAATLVTLTPKAADARAVFCNRSCSSSTVVAAALSVPVEMTLCT